MAATRKNILLIMGEDHGQWAVGAAGNRAVHTPTLDHLAETGVWMENAFTPTPVCSPSRACLLTGRLASQHGVHDYLGSGPDIDATEWLKDEALLPQLLHDHGYQTGLVGKWHLGQDAQPQAGFEHWVCHTFDYPIEHGGPHRYSLQGEIREITGYKTQILTDFAVDFLRGRDTARPFFLFVSYTAAHSPWSGHPERLAARYRADSAFEAFPQEPSPPGAIQNLESTNATRADPREALAQYYAGVSGMDEGVGRLVDELEALGLRESTLVVYLSDHGLNCGQHGIWGKGNGTLPLNMVEESIRIPLIFNQPGRVFGRQRRGEVVDLLDVFQTLADYAEVRPPDTAAYPGQSFLGVLENARVLPGWRDVQFGEYGDVRMIRTAQHKLVLRLPDGPHELYDLRRDARESTNVIADPGQSDLVAQLTAQVEAYFSRYEDPVKTGRRVKELPRHNGTEAWRTG
ncbi:MAG: sulfatase-like hydrolase/transferase [Anaerolineales bacterium]|nr:sulfatase-like hydrolase/transferase [Anaerolineales bacterium]